MAAGATALGLLLAAGFPSAPALPALPTLPAGKPLLLKDPACGDPALSAFDCLEVRAEPVPEGFEFRVTLGAPLAKGMSTCVSVFFDTDENDQTGMGGSEIWFRAAVGSRFHPNDWRPPSDAIPAPLDNRLLSWSRVVLQETVGAKSTSQSWENRGLHGEPVVEGATLRFTVPASVFSLGTEASSAGMAVKVQVQSRCGDQPLLVEHTAADDGLPLRVDGEDGDWSGAPADTDPGGELHPALRHLDLRRLRVDHEGKRLFACIDTDAPGFAEKAVPNTDISRQESITVLAEPVDAEYETSRRLTMFRGNPVPDGPLGSWAAKGRTVEAALPRTGLEARTRVLAWSEGTFSDMVPNKGTSRLERRGK